MCAFRIHPLVLHERMECIAAKKLFWKAMILIGSEASGIHRALKMYTGSLEAKRGFTLTPSNPPAYGPANMKSTICTCVQG